MIPEGSNLAQIENLGLVAKIDSLDRQVSLVKYELSLLNLLIDGEGTLPPTLPTPPSIFLRRIVYVPINFQLVKKLPNCVSFVPGIL